MTVALLATGDEIVHGDTLNTNSYDLAQILSSEGIPLGLQLTCSDKEEEIFDSIRFLVKKHNILIIIGGLGPTSDDRTRFALQRFLKIGLIEYPEAIEHIQKRLMASAVAMSAGNKQQALFPEHSILLPNPYGTAMGCYYEWKDKLLILLPGPPRECLPMFNHHALPLLQKTGHSEKCLLSWRLFGVAESEIAQKIDQALEGTSCQTGYRLETPYVECKVRCKKELAPMVQAIMDPLVAPYSITSTQQKASERLSERISELKTSISIIDEVSGGLLQTLIQRPENHSWLKFYPDEKASLNFHIRGLSAYWQGKKPGGKIELTIDYQSSITQGQEKQEIPYRSGLVIYYAAEWLSFRLLHLINQLHQ